MKGLIFTEFLEMVENRFSPDVVDDIITASRVASGGAYTSVGTYSHSEMLALVENLASVSQTSVPILVKAFGHYLFGRFVKLYPSFFNNMYDAFDFLTLLEHHVHTEVRKLYPDAELPTFTIQPSQDKSTLTMIYRSKRPFAALAEGLIEGCLEYFHEQADISMIDRSGADMTEIEFHITRIDKP